MQMSSVWIILLSAATVLGSGTNARAELVVLTSGRTFAVQSYRVDGDQITFGMRAGGEITCERALVDRILPDEVRADEPAHERTASSAVPDPPVASAVRSSPYQDLIVSMAQAHGVDPMLVGALIEVESNYRARARSRRGAMGLMQLMPSTARQYNVRNPYDPAANIAAGVKHLKGLIDRWGVELALAAYNAGEGAVRRFNGIPPYRETRHYVSRILSLAGLR